MSCPHAKDRYLLWLDPGTLRRGARRVTLFPAAKHYSGPRLAPFRLFLRTGTERLPLALCLFSAQHPETKS